MYIRITSCVSHQPLLHRRNPGYTRLYSRSPTSPTCRRVAHPYACRRYPPVAWLVLDGVCRVAALYLGSTAVAATDGFAGIAAVAVRLGAFIVTPIHRRQVPFTVAKSYRDTPPYVVWDHLMPPEGYGMGAWWCRLERVCGQIIRYTSRSS